MSPFDPTKFKPHAPAFLADPYPTYARFREHAPVCKVAPYGSYWVFRYSDVKTILEDRVLYIKNPPKRPSHASLGPFEVIANMPNGLFSLDPPRHTELRALLDPLFVSAIAGAGKAAARFASELLATARVSRRIELVSQYAMPLPTRILMDVLGIPATHHNGVAAWVNGYVAGHDPTSSAGSQAMAGTCAFALGAYYQALIRACPIKPGPGSLFELMVEEVPRGMTREEAQQTALNFTIAGFLSTVYLIATGTLNLVNAPDQLARLRSQPDLVPHAIEEMLRYDAPAQLVDRYVAEDTKLGGVDLRAGTVVTAVLGSANRDPTAFADPDRFDIHRDVRGHQAFGSGIHHCIGAPLARLVAPAAFTALLDLPVLKLEGIPQWQTNPYLRSVSNLPLAIA